MIGRVYSAAKHWLDARVPHYVVHMGIALLIGLLCLSPIAGGTYYAGREWRDWEKSHDFAPGKFRWDDFLWPFLPALVLDVALKWWLYLMFLK